MSDVRSRQHGFPLLVKRALDRVAAAFLLVLLIPLMLFIAALIAVTMGLPVLFRQRRPGYHGAMFELWKFRTMTNAVGGDGIVRPDVERLTGFGRFLRRFSLDELPQLINVLRGQLSFVGPRPLLVEYLDLYTSDQARRHDVLPGITGWAQINGRNAITWEEKFALDLWYVDHWSLWLDARILLKTLVSVLRREGIAHPGQATMPRFTGTPQSR